MHDFDEPIMINILWLGFIEIKKSEL